MMTPSFTTLLSAFLVASAAVVSAAPVVKPISDLAYSPTITSPKKGDTWTAGQMQTVSWEISSLPSTVLDYDGRIVLGRPTTKSENLDDDHPLATEFKYRDGSVTFLLPEDTESGDGYEIFLFGDSGNGSPQFSVVGKDAGLFGGL